VDYVLRLTSTWHRRFEFGFALSDLSQRDRPNGNLVSTQTNKRLFDSLRYDENASPWP
jgi:hypothetical protein